MGLWKGSGHDWGHPLDRVLENLALVRKACPTGMPAHALSFGGIQESVSQSIPPFPPFAGQTTAEISSGYKGPAR